MSNVVSLDDKRPHASGPAFCLGCSHGWVAVLPYSNDGLDGPLQCPSCHRMMGRFKYEFAPSEGQIFTCNCGNQLFKITDKYRLFCPRCAIQTNLTDLP